MNSNIDEIDQILKEHFEKVTLEEFKSNIEDACPYLLSDSKESVVKQLDQTYTNSEDNYDTPKFEYSDKSSEQPIKFEERQPFSSLSKQETKEVVTVASNNKNDAVKSIVKISKKTKIHGFLVGAFGSCAIIAGIISNMIDQGDFSIPDATIGIIPPAVAGDSLIYPYLEVTDKSGKKASINIIILSNKYRWKIGKSETLIGSNIKGTSSQDININDLNKFLKRDGIYQLVKSEGGVNEIISIGTASCEGSLKKEEERAKERALATINLIGVKMFDVAQYSFINLGRFKSADCSRLSSETSWQRTVIILGVRQEDDGVNITEAVRERLLKIPIRLEDYSLGAVNKFKVINLGKP
jgi:hypothetical protein